MNPSRSLTSIRAISIVFFLFFIFLTLVFKGVFGNTMRAQTILNFNTEADAATAYIQSDMDRNINILYGIRAFYSASENVTANEWYKYVVSLELEKNYPSVTILGFLEKVTSENKRDYPYEIYPKRVADNVYPFSFIEPLTQERKKALGFDASSDPVRMGSMIESLELDQPVISHPFMSVVTNLPSMSAYVPVYKGNLGYNTFEERQKNSIGFGVVSFRINELFEYYQEKNIFSKDISIKIYDTKNIVEASPATLLYENSSLEATGNFKKIDTINVGNKKWIVMYHSLPEYDKKSNLREVSGFIIIFGSIISILISILVYFYLKLTAERHVQ